ncbi:efflux RND transporter permease subunit [Roseospira marina]|uniref:Efflux RND transporter permease subunit n=1 Tax=Roseospira marina TaxID=140057 RepID=A0A5M6IBU1_9PROT|nr:efflux RND transporter permease subunit [Roseospira marina]KAA5605582.1 efflux RND transporter permease subunit [Roseospira marina]MBB4313354.1 multidrug efflux pump subunit AcrB [Roseospira marina]MBB5085905.1 multidrug efflux pump subunit AcrB [Roseospira marina]
MRLGLSGSLTKAFIGSPLTPLLLLAALVVGLLALVAVPREEEPQISVPMVDIMVQANGLKAVDAAELVTKPLEDIVKGIDDVEHVYSQTVDDGVTVTARFVVGTDEDVAMLRVHETIRANLNRIPLGIPEPLIVGRGINDVPIVVLTLSPEPEVAERWTDAGLHAVAEELLMELIKVDDVGLTFLVGGRADQIRVEPDPERLSLYGIPLNRLVEKLENANRSIRLGRLRDAGTGLPVVAGQTLQGVADIGDLLLTTHDGRPVYVKDVAHVVVGTAPEEHRVWRVEPAAEDSRDSIAMAPAVSIALAKRKGANAVVVADTILDRLEGLKGRVIPDGVRVEVTRNYGETALEKSNELLFHLGLATLSIVALITLAIGWREGLVVAMVVPTTILLTLFAAWMMGYTINRVSLFALIFSIGILVDDAIVVVENIARHWAMKDDRSVVQKAIEGVAEVGNPTIIATLTIVAALLPMMFVSGLMGPYMSPIPANASAAMIFSFFVAVVLTPWLLLKVAGRRAERMAGEGGHEDEGRLGRLYRRIAGPVLKTRARAWLFLIGVGVATVVACLPFYTQDVTVKLLPFDNKSELQVVLTLPEDATLEQTERTLMDAARRLADVPELTSMQLHAGTAAPFNFNGLVRHAYLRDAPYMGDLQLNLTPKHDRDRPSHAIALEVRARLADMDVPEGTALSVVEVPPGPPVLATLLAEIYGPDAETRRAVAEEVKRIFRAVDFIVDVDDSWGDPAERIRFALDQQALEYHGVEEEAVHDTLAALLGGVSVGYSHRGHGVDPVEIAVRLPKSRLSPGEYLLSTPVPGAQGYVELGDVVRVTREPASHTLFRRDGHFAEMVQADLAGRFEAPIYGMLAVQDRIAATDWDALGLPKPAIRLHGQPEDESGPTLLWDGEWEITYVTFRDMGAAFGVAILGIYLLVVAQFGSFKAPLVILTPVPLTLIGIVFGHWLFGAPFTATSMIGFIALAGIIVRNSILLVDFIKHSQPSSPGLRDALLTAGAIRFKPILLTALAAMIGGAFILADPIFQGLALSLVFGLASSTALTLLVIPAIYIALRDDGVPAT